MHVSARECTEPAKASFFSVLQGAIEKGKRADYPLINRRLESIGLTLFPSMQKEPMSCEKPMFFRILLSQKQSRSCLLQAC